MARPSLRPDPDTVRDGSLRSRSRRRRADDNALYVPEEYKQPGMSYEWKKESVLGQEDPSYMSSQMENGWEPVALEKMPRFGRKGEVGVVRREGLVLCERPVELTREAEEEELERARNVVLNNQRKMLGADYGAGMPNRGSKIRSSYGEAPAGRIPITSQATTRGTVELED